MNLLFIYNANSGINNSVIDSIHKIISPSTYKCSLCKLTHGVLKEKEEWSDFINGSKHSFSFSHKDEFEEQFKEKISYPCIVTANGRSIEIKIETEALNKISE